MRKTANNQYTGGRTLTPEERRMILRYAKDPSKSWEDLKFDLDYHHVPAIQAVITGAGIKWRAKTDSRPPALSSKEEFEALKALAEDPCISQNDAADRFGISTRTLRRALKRYEIQWLTS